MTVHARQRPIAFLAPELPALSATFVYEEILCLERRGLTVVPVSVPCRRHLRARIAGDGPLRRELEYLVAELGLGDTVRSEGNLPHRQVRV